MENDLKDIDFDLGGLSGAAMRKRAFQRRKQERISWLTQLAVPALLIGFLLWVFGTLIVGLLADLSLMITTTPGAL